MTNFSRLFSALLIICAMLFGIVACVDEDDCEPAPISCDQTPADKGYLYVQLTINGNNPAVPVKVFRGNFENNDLVEDTVATGSRLSFYLPVDQYYSVIAEYLQADGDTVFAIDGDDIQVEEVEYCDASCFELDNGHIDVKLHFPKAALLRKRPY